MENGVPFIVHESIVARMERVIKRLWILSLLLAVFLVGSNAAWLYYESQWQVTSETVESYADNGSAAIANSEGSVIFYGGENEDNGR